MFNQVDLGFVIMILVNHTQWLHYDSILKSKNLFVMPGNHIFVKIVKRLNR